MLVSRSASLTDSNRTISASLRAVASEIFGGQAMIAAQAQILLDFHSDAALCPIMQQMTIIGYKLLAPSPGTFCPVKPQA